MSSQICALFLGWFVALTLLVLQVFLLIKVEALSIHSIEVPAAVMNSSQVTLVCNYSLQNDEQLYSVKWYKNYVEFYRFQPLQAYYSSSSSADQSQADNQQHSKQEFELDGISLNLSKSNATHVFLKQTSLASEGTYKCEVSADSPSFATVSIERKMKVYVLPKQKLFIIDNNLAPNQQHNINNFKPQQSIKQAINYHLNDFVNLTCVSAHSRPGAKLTWFINEVPVINSSRWLTHHQQPQPQPRPLQQQHHLNPSKSMLNQQEEQQKQLIESRLTLTFKIQANHLSRETNTFQSQQRHQMLQIKCLAMLSVEFDSNTVISVLGEKKTLNNKRNRNSQIAARLSADHLQVTPLLPSVSRLQSDSAQLSMNEEQEEKLTVTSVSHQTIHNGSFTNNLSNNLEYSEYKWPQQTESLQRMPSPTSFSNPWIKSPVTTTPTTSNIPNSQDSEFSMTDLNTGNRLDSNNRASIRQPSSPSSSSGIMVPIMWTNRQIKLQSEFIDQKLQFTHSNELDTPTIEARLVQDLPADSSSDDSNSNTSSQSDNSADISAASAFDDNFTGEPEARTTFNRAPVSEAPPSNLTPDTEDQSYELNDMVQFTCYPRVASSDRNDVRKKIYSKWFINNKEINAKQINSFDGSKFYHTRDIQPDSSHSNSSRQNSTFINPNKAKKPHQAEPISLLVEFTPSLFQTKEFNLKCRTIVEQPLIEFEQQLTITTTPSTVPSNQHPYIQAIDQKQRNSNVRNQSGLNSRQNKRRDRNRDGLVQLSPSSSSSGTIRLSTIADLEFKPIIILMIYSLAITNYFSINPVNI